MRYYAIRFVSIIIILCILPFLSQSQTVLKGKLKIRKTSPYTVYLSNFDGFESITSSRDSCQVGDDGNFKFNIKRTNDSLQIVRLIVSNSNKGQFYLNQDGFHDNSILLPIRNKTDISLTADADSLFYSVLFGGKNDLNALFKTLRIIKEPLKERLRFFLEESKKMDDKEKDSLVSRYMDTVKIYSNSEKLSLSNLIDTEHNIYNVVYYMYEYFKANGGSYDDIFLRESIDRLPANLSITENLKKKNIVYSKVHIDLVMDSATFISLGPWRNWTECKTNTILIFWASWCGPCRQAIRTKIKDFYNKSQQNGIQLISISLDQTQRAAMSAFKLDGASWPQFIDQKRIFHALQFQFIPVYLVYSNKNKSYTVFRDFIQATESLGNQ